MSNFWKSFLCVLACVFLCVASFFTGYFFRDTVRIKQSETINSLCAVKPADTVSDTYSFQGSNFATYISFYEYNSNLSYTGGWLTTNTLVNDLNNSTVASSFYIPLTFYLNKPARFDDDTSNLGIGFNYNLTGDGSEYFDSHGVHIPLSSFGANDYGRFIFGSDHLTYPFDVVFFYAYRLDANFNFNVKSVNISLGKRWNSSDTYVTSFVFTDVNNYTCRFEIVMDKNYPGINSVTPDTRTYYFINEFSDNDYYEQGYSTGYNFGLTTGTQTGYNDGYNVGYSDGRSDGYDEGVNSTTQYSFANLFTAVVEAPVNVFISLLDFNIMGYNLLSIVVGLLTLGVVVLVIKLCLGGK